MNGNQFIIPILALCLVVSFSDLCSGKEKKSPLTVKRIVYTPEETGGESIKLFCNQPCKAELSSLKGENPRVVMDMKGVSLIQTKALHVNAGGKLVKKIRSYLDKKTKILRVVLDMEPSKNYIVYPIQDPVNNAYMLRIEESEQKPERSEDDKSFLLPQSKSSVSHRPVLSPDERQEGRPQEAAPNPEKRSAEKIAEEVPSVDQGQAQLNDGEFAAAVDTFTKILATHPQDSLIYRLRGDAYDNLGEQQKAIADWTQAARLGDTIIRPHLDSLKVKWR